jgi:diaminohydroxyphosphoribosylaminopyrimidine deaminase / 5-amino-6-(5-phosphoribosylamino)uracil reductase
MSTTEHIQDARWMRRAIALARRGQTPPNPMVGCVIVANGVVVGEGWHRLAGTPHAEAVALAMAGEAARGATAYVALEPCAHYGRTPPCADALIAAGVRRVVVPLIDPNPRVSGKGVDRLRAAGIAVEVGLRADEARELNAAFFHFQATGLPYVTLKAAMTLDGKIATRTGDSRWITGETARRYAHRERARSGAVLCGIGTVLADDPLLTARAPGTLRQPLRVVLDTSARMPLSSKLATTATESPVLVFVGDRADPDRVAKLADMQIEVQRVPTDNADRVSVRAVLAELGRRGIISVLIEGGGAVHASFLAERQAHRLLWFLAPRIVGGIAAPTPVEGHGMRTIAESVWLAAFRVRRLGGDLLIETRPS